MLEFTTSRVDKSSTVFKPSIKKKRRKQAAEQVREELTAAVEEPEVVVPEVEVPPAGRVDVQPIVQPIVQPEVQPLVQPEVIIPPRNLIKVPVVNQRRTSISIPKKVPRNLEVNSATMSDLIRHKFHTGKLSEAEQRRRQERKKPANSPPKEIKPKPHVPEKPRGAQLITINGEIRIDQQSLSVPIMNTHEEEMEMEEAVEEDAANRYVTAASFRNRKKATSPRWTPIMQERFYLGLSYFGTDFKMISYMFPGLTQRHIKLKFKAEERSNSSSITTALRRRLKAPAELRRKILVGVKHKQILEDSYFLNKMEHSEYTGNLEAPNEQQAGVAVETKTKDVDNALDESTENVEKETSTSKQVPLVLAKTDEPPELPELDKPQSQVAGVKVGKIKRKRNKALPVTESVE